MRFVDAFRTEEMAARTADETVALAADYARCARITRQASSNFYYAFMLLPLERRRALYAVYAFCRFVDDIADDDSITDPAAMLARWRDELDNVFAGTPTRPVSRALAENTARFNIPRRYFEEVIDGVEMDLSQRRYETFDELSLYCRRVASAVGLICIEIFGYSNPATRIYAEKLGLAFQLTNIIRDVREDAERGRIYLPLEDLRRFGVTESELLDGVYNDRFRALMAFEASRARRLLSRSGGRIAQRGSSFDALRRSDAVDLQRAARTNRALRVSRLRSSSSTFHATQALPRRPRMGRFAAGARVGIATMAVEAKDVVVIGGGFAGLAAGVALGARGFRVALLESKPALGGRAFSFPDAETGDFVDNGQHVLMGCYHETLNFLDQIGTRRELIFHRNLEIEMLDGPQSTSDSENRRAARSSAHERCAAPLPSSVVA